MSGNVRNHGDGSIAGRRGMALMMWRQLGGQEVPLIPGGRDDNLIFVDATIELRALERRDFSLGNGLQVPQIAADFAYANNSFAIKT